MCPGRLWCKFAVPMGRRSTWPSGLAMSGVSRTMAWLLRPCTTTMERGTAGLPSNGWPMRQKSAGWRACCMQARGPRCDWTSATNPWMAIIRTLPRCSSSIVACFTVTTVMSLWTPSSALLQGRGRSTMKRTKTTWGPPVATHSWPSGSASRSPTSWPQRSSGRQWMGGYCRRQHPRVSNAQFPSASPWGRYAGASAGDTRGAKYPLAHVVTRHFTLAAGVSMADMDSLFTGQIPTKVLISLVSNEASVSTWQKNPFNFAHIELNSACLVVDGRPLLAQPWQPDFMQGLYAETYHALLKFSGRYSSYWSNGMYVGHFVGGIMLLSWDLMPDDSNGVAYLSSRHLGTVKASLRFAKLLLATTTLIAYAQYDNLVVVDAYQCLHHWHLPAWFPAAYLINTARGGDAGEHLLGVFLKDSQHAQYFNSFGITPPESNYWWLLSMDYLDIWYSTKML